MWRRRTLGGAVCRVEKESTVGHWNHYGWSGRATRRGINKRENGVDLGVQEEKASCGSQQSTCRSKLTRVG